MASTSAASGGNGGREKKVEKEAKVADESSFAGTVTRVVIFRTTVLNVEM